MGDDAEYYMEQQAEAARFAHASEQAALQSNQKYLFCWVNGCEQDMSWNWEPMSRVLGIFFNLHDAKKIGSEYFLSCSLPEQEYEYEEYFDEDYTISTEAKEGCEVKLIEGLEFGVVSNDNEASSEVLVVSQKDIALLKIEATRQKDCAKNLKEQIISEMLDDMVFFMESNPDYNLFVFARDI